MIKYFIAALTMYSVAAAGDYKQVYDYKTNSYITIHLDSSRATAYDNKNGTYTVTNKTSAKSTYTYDYGTGTYSSTTKSGNTYTAYDYKTGTYSTYSDPKEAKNKKAAYNSKLLLKNDDDDDDED